jgi:hypothetical protein
MAIVNHNEIFYSVKKEEDAHWDKEWAEDWQKIVEIYNTIEHLEYLFDQLDVSELRRLTQRQIIINLQKYAYSLLKVIQEKYSD